MYGASDKKSSSFASWFSVLQFFFVTVNEIIVCESNFNLATMLSFPHTGNISNRNQIKHNEFGEWEEGGHWPATMGTFDPGDGETEQQKNVYGWLPCRMAALLVTFSS